jgi:hypothetical protein
MKNTMHASDFGWLGVFWLIARSSASLVWQFVYALWRLTVWAFKQTFILYGKYADHQALRAAKDALDAAARAVEPTVVAASAAPQPAPQAASQPATPQAATRRSAMNSTTDEPQARVVGRAAEPEVVKSADHYKSGLNAGDLVIADSHAQKKMGGRLYRFSMYREAGRVVRFDMKDKVLLKDFTRSTAAALRVPFSLEQAVLFTSREVLAARKAAGTSAKGKAVKLTPALPRPEQEPAAGPGSASPPAFEEPPPWPEMPPEYESYDSFPRDDDGYVPEAAVTPSATTGSRRVATPQPMDSDVVEEEGECSWENKQFQGEIQAQYMALRKPTGREPYKIFTMLLKLSDGTKKEFTGVELQGRSEDLQLANGDTIEIRKGVQPYKIVRPDSTEQRKRNVYAIRVIAKAMRRKFG